MAYFPSLRYALYRSGHHACLKLKILTINQTLGVKGMTLFAGKIHAKEQ